MTNKPSYQELQGLVAELKRELQWSEFRNRNNAKIYQKESAELTSVHEWLNSLGCDPKQSLSEKMNYIQELIEKNQPPVVFTTTRTKKLADITGADIPRGLSAEDIAIDYK